MHKLQALTQRKKGFTLIELLVVIAILAVLATAVVLVLNPAELIRQGRDSTRLSDLDTLNSALAIYLADVDPSQADLGVCAADTARCTYDVSTLTPATSTFANRTACSVDSTTEVDGNGWVDVNLALISGGSPLPKLPIDPANSAVYHYEYACDDTNDWYEFGAYMESKKYGQGGTGDVVSSDGGDNPSAYETGNDPGLDL